LISREGASEAAQVTGSEAWAIVSRIIAAILIYGGAGWFIGRFFDAPGIGLAIGSLIGVGLATYTTVVKLSYLDESALPVGVNETGTSWSRRMTQIRIRNARETSE
jgi:F0F1-type ATP synthase assembly protein I